MTELQSYCLPKVIELCCATARAHQGIFQIPFFLSTYIQPLFPSSRV